MERQLFLDTNALLELQDIAFQEQFVIAQQTLEEIEHIKTSGTKDGEIKYKARQVAKLLDKNFGNYVVVPYTPDIAKICDERYLEHTPDNIILSSAAYYSESNPTVVCTDDINCKFISKNIFQLPTKSVDELNLIVNHKDYKGYKEVILSDEELSYFYAHMTENPYDNNVNEYLILKQQSSDEVIDCYRWTGTEFKKVTDKTIKSRFFGDKLRPKDKYQACVIDSILNNQITEISGKAGSGKTLLSLMTAMSLIDAGKYDRIVMMFNPAKTKGSIDMGYYSGDATEKALQNSVGSILTTKFGDRYAVDMLLQQDQLRLVSMADVRGMEVRDNEILYISECQNTTSELLKLCLSRASSGCKVIIEGDFDAQVDSYMFGGSANGMRRALEVLTGEPEFGYVELPHVWRSRLASLVEKF